MKKDWLVKTLALGIVVLFIGVSYQPIIAENTIAIEKEQDYYNVDFEQAKEYLFQTIIDIANNADVKNLLKQTGFDIFDSDYDFKFIYEQLLLKKTRVFFSTLFSRPKLTTEYLNKFYKNSIEIIDIIGEDELIEIIESIKITNTGFFNDLQNIITNDKALSNKISKLEAENCKINPNSQFTFPPPFICKILDNIAWGSLALFIYWFEDFPIDEKVHPIFYWAFGYLIVMPSLLIGAASMFIYQILGCHTYNPY